MLPLTIPGCPTTSEIRIITGHGADVAVPLDFNRWEAKGSIHRYRDNKPRGDPSGVRSIRYGVGKLAVSVEGGGYAAEAIEGPAAWVETTFAVAGNVSVSLTGQPFDRSNWTADSGASVARPTHNMDVPVPSSASRTRRRCCA